MRRIELACIALALPIALCSCQVSVGDGTAAVVGAALAAEEPGLTDAGPGPRLKPPDPRDVEIAVDGEGSDLGILSTGETITDDVRVACWADYDTCTTDYRINTGELSGGYSGGSKVRAADNYFEAADCGWADNAGPITNGEYLVIYVGNAIAYDTVVDVGVCVQFELETEEFHSTNCVDNPTNNDPGIQRSACITDPDDYSWEAAWADSKADCEGGYGDPGRCHLLDAGYTDPGSGYYSYKTHVRVRVCDSYDSGTGGCQTNCTTFSEQDGCFVIQWT